jgi:putative autoinducer-2 (AI-2) aldolase
MPDADDVVPADSYHHDVPQTNAAFNLKGSGARDWEMQNRLARVFRPATGRTVILAIDHG